ncbi:MAG: MFS transporter [Candidatus Schekmanbacteria bacterium]|nr:MAG: MFS transporter [Candidatus Schekmanbacteria bacterium]
MNNSTADLEKKKKVQDIKNLISWLSYDISETLFSLLIVTLIYAIYFRKIIASSSPYADFYWGLCGSLSMFIVAFSSPLAGAAADIKRERKNFLIISGIIASIFTMMLALPNKNEILLASVLFIIANVFYGLSLTFYNSLITDVSSPENIGKISGFGWATGYAGALFTLVLFYPLLKNGINEGNILNVKIIFILTGIFFLLFMLPLALFYKEHSTKKTNSYKQNNILISSYERVFGTIKNASNHRNLLLFLVAFFLYNDGIATVIYFSSIFATQTLGFTIDELIVLFLSIQISAMAGAFLFGFLTDKIGAKKVIVITLLIWTTVISMTYIVVNHILFFIIALTGGIAMGACQSASRSFMALNIPKERESEFFGFYSLYSRFSSIVGPFIFGIIASYTGNQRKAVLSTLIFFLGGLATILKVKENSDSLRKKEE